jgi:hypothetical protein
MGWFPYLRMVGGRTNSSGYSDQGFTSHPRATAVSLQWAGNLFGVQTQSSAGIGAQATAPQFLFDAAPPPAPIGSLSVKTTAWGRERYQKTPSNFTYASGRFGSVLLVSKTVCRIAPPTHDRQRLRIDRPEKPKNAAVRLSGPLMNGLPEYEQKTRPAFGSSDAGNMAS